MAVADAAAMRLLLAEAGIRHRHARYIDAVWRKDRAAFVDCFTADGCWTIAGDRHVGRDAIGEAIERLTAKAARVQLISGPPLVALTGADAVARVMVTELVKLKDGGSAMTLGVYHDRHAEDGGAWRFADRRFALHYRGPPDLSGALAACPDPGAFPEA